MKERTRTALNLPNGSFLHREKSALHKGETFFIVVMLLIPVVNWLVFWLYINVNSFALAFQDTNGGFTFDNFINVFQNITRDTDGFRSGIFNTLVYFAVGLLITTPLSFTVSYFIFKKVRGSKVFRILFYLPNIIPVVVLATVYEKMVGVGGPVSVICQWLGINYPKTGLLRNESTVVLAVCIYNVLMGIGGNMLIFNGAMIRISNDVLEAARLDGAGPFRELVSVILPLTWPTISTVIVLQMTGLFTASGPILLLVNGSPSNNTTISYWIYNQTTSHNYGGVAAAGMLFTAIAIPLILGVRKFMDRYGNAEY